MTPRERLADLVGAFLERALHRSAVLVPETECEVTQPMTVVGPPRSVWHRCEPSGSEPWFSVCERAAERGAVMRTSSPVMPHGMSQYVIKTKGDAT